MAHWTSWLAEQAQQRKQKPTCLSRHSNGNSQHPAVMICSYGSHLGTASGLHHMLICLSLGLLAYSIE
jgi:hypothetical protein